jgi:hypothetical protein
MRSLRQAGKNFGETLETLNGFSNSLLPLASGAGRQTQAAPDSGAIRCFNPSLDERSKRRHPMNHADFAARNIEPLFHPVSHYDSPDEVLQDGSVSIDEKGTILSSWASDMYAVESHSAFRDVPSVSQRLWLDDPWQQTRATIQCHRLDRQCLASASSRLRSETSQREVGRHAVTISRGLAAATAVRWTREENIRRDRKLLSTRPTELERSFIERRLAEELHDCSTNHHYGGNGCLLA